MQASGTSNPSSANWKRAITGSASNNPASTPCRSTSGFHLKGVSGAKKIWASNGAKYAWFTADAYKAAKAAKAAAAERRGKELEEKAEEMRQKDLERNQKAEAAEKAEKKAEKDAKEKKKKHEAAQEKKAKKVEKEAKERAAKAQAAKEKADKAAHEKASKEKASKAPVQGKCSCRASLFNDNHWKGSRIATKVVTHDYEWNGDGQGHSTHSVYVSAGCKDVILRDDDPNTLFGGYAQDKRLHSSIGDLPHDLEKDLRGLKLIPKTGCVKNCAKNGQRNCRTACNDEAIVWEHNFGGWHAHFPKGSFKWSQCKARGMRNDQATSIFVPPGCKLTAYQHGSFGGWHATLGPGKYDSHALKRKGFRNDDMSSLKVTDEHTSTEEEELDLYQQQTELFDQLD